MVEALKVKSLAYTQRWGEAAEPLNLIERSKILVENLQIRDVIKDHDDRARRAVRDRLNVLYADHAERGLIRSGATLRDGIGIFAEEAGNLIDSLVAEVLALARNAGAFALIMEGLEQYLALLDGELGRIVKKVDYENQDVGASRGIARAAENMWAEKRAGLIEKLERHRWEFLIPAQDVPHVEQPQDDEQQAEQEPEPAEASAQEGQTMMKRDDEASDHDGHPAAEAAEPPVAEAVVPPLAEADAVPEAESRDEASYADRCGKPSDRSPATSLLADHWHDMWAETAMLLWSGKLCPKSLEDLRCAMAGWFADRSIETADAEIGECARRLWSKYAATQRVTSRIADAVRNHREGEAGARFDWAPETGAPGPCRAVDPAGAEQGEAAESGRLPVFIPRLSPATDLTAPALILE